MRNIAVVLFEGAEELDFAGPWEVFTMLGEVQPGSVSVFTVAERAGLVTCAKGMQVQASYSFADAPPVDVLVIPGGRGTRREMTHESMLAFIRKTAATAEVMTSVCTGAFVFARAGLLEGRRATTHWASLEHLRKEPGVTVVEQRFVDEGPVITASGVSAGIDMALHVVGRLFGAKTARTVQKWMEYYPEPPFQEDPA